MRLDKQGKKKLLFLFLSIFILGTLIIGLIVPKAEVKIRLKEKIFKQIYQAKLDPDIVYLRSDLGLIPAYKKEISLNDNEESLHFRNDDIRTYVISKIRSEINAAENINEEKLQYHVELIDNQEGKIKIFTEAIIIPKINIENLKNEIRGKINTRAYNYLKNLPQIHEVDIISTPNYLFFIPLLKSRIAIIIKTSDN